MLFRSGADGRRLGVLVHHDDAEREYAYDRNSQIGRLDQALDLAPNAGWVVVSMKDDWQTVFPQALAALALLAGTIPAAAQSTDAPATGDRWTFVVAPYLWGISLDGKAKVKGVEADVDVPFSDAVKDLSLGAMLLVDARKGRFGIAANGVFTRVSPDDEVGPLEIHVTTDLAQLGIGPYYRAVEWQYGESASGRPLRLVLEPWVGARLNHLRLELELHPGPQFDDSQT